MLYWLDYLLFTLSLICCHIYIYFVFFFIFFFFQAEDGIRDRDVTGVQTCALPIFGDRLEHLRHEPPRVLGLQRHPLRAPPPLRFHRRPLVRRRDQLHELREQGARDRKSVV